MLKPPTDISPRRRDEAREHAHVVDLAGAIGREAEHFADFKEKETPFTARFAPKNFLDFEL